MEIDLNNEWDHEEIQTIAAKPKQNPIIPRTDSIALLDNDQDTLKVVSDAGDNRQDTIENTQKYQQPNDLPTIPLIGAGYPSISAKTKTTSSEQQVTQRDILPEGSTR